MAEAEAEAAAAAAEAAAAEAAAAESDALLEAQLAAATADAAPERHSLSIYGFMDFRFSAMVGDTIGTFSRYPTFAVGNFNVYLDAELGDGWRSLAEVRYMYLPHGSTAFYDLNAGDERFEAEAADYADFNRPLNWGGIEIERAFIEYEFHDAFTLRMGQWITPYGIWVVDHGSPVIVGIVRPYVVGEALFPERQTGLEGYGAVFLEKVKLGYHLTLSNGRGPIDAYQDLDMNKGLGGRVFVEHPGEVGTLTVGASGYLGTYTDRSQSLSLDENNGVTSDNPPTEAFDEASLAFDVKWEQKTFFAQAEGIVNDIAYYEGARPEAAAGLNGPPGFLPDYRRYGGYVLFGYRTPWWNVTPFAIAEYNLWGKHFAAPDVAAMWVGINVRPTPRVVWKLAYTHAFFPNDTETDITFNSLNLVSAQVAWSF